ncbi:DNA-directed RNA polymerase III subunit RPC8 [Ataeniobius toweri]|uniref:DNA-directed RNA polymerase subunit n=1 Tax=Ataeniobius toweri TaxID=208326 RepID=A0ABU7C7J6_9TELE|nr:DNA-directed RNA polymerase III subunit RPC8 [Ataeniobius toweri]
MIGLRHKIKNHPSSPELKRMFLNVLIFIVNNTTVERYSCGQPFWFTVTMGFFDDILIPPESLQQPAKFDEAEQVWLWEYETEEGAHDLYMDQGEEIRFRVADEVFVDTSPTGPATATPDTPAQPGQSTAPPAQESGDKKQAPYTLIGTICESGLGLLSWWNS